MSDKPKKKSSKSKSNSSRVARMERKKVSMLTLASLAIILGIAAALAVVLHFVDDGSSTPTIHLINLVDNILTTALTVIFLDLVVVLNNENRKRRDERRAILRHDKVIRPIIDMYLARKNAVITPSDKTISKFQVDAEFSVSDMRDMYTPSELVSDVGKSKIEMYRTYQYILYKKMSNIVESVDFTSYQGICDAALAYIGASTYGSSALDAVVEYQTATVGTKSMRTVIVNQIRTEPVDGKFVDASPTMKNVYLVHQMITDQEKALAKYMKIIELLESEDSKKKKAKNRS